MIVGDPNLRDFYGRVRGSKKRVPRAMALRRPARSGFRQLPPRRVAGMSIFGPLVVAVVHGARSEGDIHYKVGASTYNERVEALHAGQGFDRLGAG